MGFCPEGLLRSKAMQAVKKGSSAGWGSVQMVTWIYRTVQAIKKKGSSVGWGSVQRGYSDLKLAGCKKG